MVAKRLNECGRIAALAVVFPFSRFLKSKAEIQNIDRYNTKIDIYSITFDVKFLLRVIFICTVYIAT